MKDIIKDGALKAKLFEESNVIEKSITEKRKMYWRKVKKENTGTKIKQNRILNQ